MRIVEDFVTETDVLGDHPSEILVNPFELLAGLIGEVRALGGAEDVGAEFFELSEQGEVGVLNLLGERAFQIAGEEVADVVHVRVRWKGLRRRIAERG